MKKLLVFSFSVLVLANAIRQPPLAQGHSSSAPASGDKSAVEPRLYFRKSGREIPNSRLSIKEGELPNPYGFKALYYKIENIDVRNLEIVKTEWGPEKKTLQITLKNQGSRVTNDAYLALAFLQGKNFKISPWTESYIEYKSLYNSQSIPKLQPGQEYATSLTVPNLNGANENSFWKTIVDPEKWTITLKCYLASELIEVQSKMNIK